MMLPGLVIDVRAFYFPFRTQGGLGGPFHICDGCECKFFTFWVGVQTGKVGKGPREKRLRSRMLQCRGHLDERGG